MRSFYFVRDKRLGIDVPVMDGQWEDVPWEERADILMRWEEIRGRIPDRIQELERMIVVKQAALYEEEHFETSCKINYEIAELASMINDLHLWYRLHQEFDSKIHH
ncbi:hypothetical protein [Paenibacillus sp. 481]|uniref:hypothetical protein n=1 Tax=Paenibacillus sp. 481 TaxID=2835869 RepID=UPI001E3E787C|nr:hypothetical protein [Paenibacillus sp. 481]UHA72595.1 hypothetical protein KIK04_18340 [Paenibacillus sp. 481]